MRRAITCVRYLFASGLLVTWLALISIWVRSYWREDVIAYPVLRPASISSLGAVLAEIRIFMISSGAGGIGFSEHGWAHNGVPEAYWMAFDDPSFPSPIHTDAMAMQMIPPPSTVDAKALTRVKPILRGIAWMQQLITDQIYTTKNSLSDEGFVVYNGGFSSNPRAVLAAPYWFVALLLMIPTYPLLRRVFVNKLTARRRARQGLCLTCGYDLRATPDLCPECGTIPPGKTKEPRNA